MYFAHCEYTYIANQMMLMLVTIPITTLYGQEAQIPIIQGLYNYLSYDYINKFL